MTQAVTKITSLTVRQQQQIKQLQAEAFSALGYLFKIDPSVLTDSPTNNAKHFLLANNDKSLGYMLTNYYNQTEMKVAIIDSVPSSYKQFIQLAKNEAIENDLTKLLFAVDRHDQEMIANAITSKFNYSFSEYRLVFNDTVLTKSNSSDLTVRTAETTDLPVINELDMQGFGEHITIHEADLPSIKLALINNQVIGKIKLEKTADSLGIFGFVVNQNYRSKGYGQELLAHVIADSIKAKRSYIYLEVAATNPSALKLYDRCGFKQEVCFDYYEYRL